MLVKSAKYSQIYLSENESSWLWQSLDLSSRATISVMVIILEWDVLIGRMLCKLLQLSAHQGPLRRNQSVFFSPFLSLWLFCQHHHSLGQISIYSVCYCALACNFFHLLYCFRLHLNKSTKIQSTIGTASLLSFKVKPFTPAQVCLGTFIFQHIWHSSVSVYSFYMWRSNSSLKTIVSPPWGSNAGD